MGEEDGELLLNRYTVSILKDERVREIRFTTMGIYIYIHLKMVKMVHFMLCVFTKKNML